MGVIDVSISQSLASHEKDYKAAAWTDYSVEELFWWVKLFSKRAGMRSNPEKRAKDLYDAKNYLDMLANAIPSDAAASCYLDAKALYEAAEAK